MTQNTAELVTNDPNRRWWALTVLCLGVLMIATGGTVNVALPSIRTDLGFTEGSLVWIVNAYLLTFGGFLLLGGRLGDLFGHRRLFLFGTTLYTLASLGCGLANSQGVLIGARAVQGLGAAVISAVALSVIMNLFTEARERAKAIGIYGFVNASSGSIGLLLGGTLTSAIGWRWIFLVNLPIGAVVCALGVALLPNGPRSTVRGRLDLAGAATVTASLMVAVYAIANGNVAGWISAQTVLLLTSAGALLVVFIRIEGSVHAPLVPLGLFRMHNLVIANVIGMLLAAAMFTSYFTSALYLQLVLRYSPIHVGVAFLPASVTTALFSLGPSAKLVIRYGIKPMLVLGLLLETAGLVLFARAPVDGSVAADVLPGMLLLGLGGGMAFNPLLLAAMSGVTQRDSGLASGFVNTSLTMGGAFGLAIVASTATARTNCLLESGTDLRLALNSGYHFSFFTGAIFAAVAACLGAALLRIGPQAPTYDHEEGGAVIPVTVCDDRERRSPLRRLTR